MKKQIGTEILTKLLDMKKDIVDLTNCKIQDLDNAYQDRFFHVEKQSREYSETHKRVPDALTQINEIEANMEKFASEIGSVASHLHSTEK